MQCYENEVVCFHFCVHASPFIYLIAHLLTFSRRSNSHLNKTLLTFKAFRHGESDRHGYFVKLLASGMYSRAKEFLFRLTLKGSSTGNKTVSGDLGFFALNIITSLGKRRFGRKGKIDKLYALQYRKTFQNIKISIK